jgi:hypothetical protein
MKVLVIACLLLTAKGSMVYAQADCEQKFVIFEKTKGEYALMFYRVSWSAGGCGQGSFHALFLIPDRVHSFTSNTLYGNWVSPLMANLPIEEYLVISDTAGRFYLNDTAWIAPPAFDSTLDSMYAVLPKHDARTWYWECYNDCDRWPIFEGFCPERIYAHPGALYINYGFREVRYYPESNYLIILTEQPLIDDTKHTMNGLIIYKVDGWKWLSTPPCEWDKPK